MSAFVVIGSIGSAAAQNQDGLDNTFPPGCRQNKANPSGGSECKRIDKETEPYKNKWFTTVYVHPNNVKVEDDSAENVRNMRIAAVNAEQERLEALHQAAGYNYVGYSQRMIVNPNATSCLEPTVSTSWSFAPDFTRLGVSARCPVWLVDTRYAPNTPGYFVNDNPIIINKLAICEEGWKASGSGPPDQYGNYTKYPSICYREDSSKEMGNKCASGKPALGTMCGNPINFATGNKFQIETDYVGTGPMPLRIERAYNSATPTDNFESMDKPPMLSFGRNWRFHYDRRMQGAGTNTVWVSRADGKVIYFNLYGGAWKADSEIADRLTSGPSGYSYFNSEARETETFDGQGRLASIADQSGNVTTLQYSGKLLTKVTDPFGRSLTFSYGGLRPKIATITDPQGGVYTYAYSGEQVAQVTYPDGTTRSYLYVSSGVASNGVYNFNLLSGIVDGNNVRLTTYLYDANGKAYSSEWAGGVNKYTVSGNAVTDPLGRVKTYTLGGINGVRTLYDVSQPSATTSYPGTVVENFRYDAKANLTLYTNPRGISTTRVFDTTRDLETSRTESSNSLPRTTTTTWHPTFRLPATIAEPVRINGVNGTKTTSFGYDSVGNLTQRVVTTPSGTRTWTWTYNANGQVLTATDPMGRTTTNTYYPNTEAQNLSFPNSRGMLATSTNPLGQVASVQGYNAHGQPTQIADSNGLVTELAYDTRTRLVTRTVQGEVTRYQYNNNGQLARVTMPDSSYVDYSYDAAQRLYRIQDGLGNYFQYTLDNAGNRTREDVYDKTGALARSRTRLYDDLSRVIQDIGGASPATQVTQYAYDASGNKYAESDPNGIATYYNYDGLERLTQITNALTPTNALTKFEYDLQNNLTKVIDPKNLATTYNYNGFNELTSQVSPDTGTTSFTYDAAGNMLTKTDARGVTVTYAYDALNRVSAINYPAVGSVPAQSVVYAYDNCTFGTGRLCSFTDRTGTTTYTYDIQGRVRSKAQMVNGITQTVGYRYNALGQMDEMTLPSGRKLSITYLNNRVAGIAVNGTPIVKDADYEPFGPIGEWTWGNDSVSRPNKHTRYFDLDGRNTKIESGAGTDPALVIYDAASRITALQRQTGATVDPAKSASYAYDNLNRLVSVTPGAGNPANSQSFSYDLNGNRLSNTVAGGVTTYNIAASSHRLLGLNGWTAKNFTYDAAGNRLTDGNQTWSYGGDGRPSSILFSGAAPVTLQSGINALGQRVLKSVNSAAQTTITRFVYDEAGRLIGEYDNNGQVIQETVWLNDIPVAVLK
jgi:YD repeat-containing protein